MQDTDAYICFLNFALGVLRKIKSNVVTLFIDICSLNHYVSIGFDIQLLDYPAQRYQLAAEKTMAENQQFTKCNN